nr:recombinase family protein [Gloeocapsopsis dulcis]
MIAQFCTWIDKTNGQSYPRRQRNTVNSQEHLSKYQTAPAILCLAANDENRRELVERIVSATAGKYPVRAKTPLGFFQDEVMLFWPLLIQILNLRAQFPVRLRPETEQELATRLWRSHFDSELRHTGVNEYRLIRRILDILQLAAYSGTPITEIAPLLERSFGAAEVTTTGIVETPLLESMLLQWRNWCLERGLLTYGIITELYDQYLLPDSNYQQHLLRRYQAVLADDVDDYPGIMRDFFDFLLDREVVGAFTYNPDGRVRLGLGADPDYLAGLRDRCRVELLPQPLLNCLANTLSLPVAELLDNTAGVLSLPSCQSIQTTSRRDLLQQTAEVIAQAVRSHQIQPQEIAIIAPGLDAIARYTLVELLSKQGIPVAPLNDQRPLVSYPIIRALLTLLSFVYPGLGRLVDRNAVAEMLVVLSRNRHESSLIPNIDLVRAGLIADHCYAPHPEQPNLLPVTAYDRWDRLGYAATTAYGEIIQWIELQRSQQQQRLIPSPISLLDRAIQRFLWNGSNLPYEQLAALRELLETAQHYWEVDTRFRQTEAMETPPHAATQFVQLLQSGTITANPYPVRPIGPMSRAITLATIFQYRSSRKCHRWQFWLDAGSPLWLSGGAATLFGAPLFLHDRYARGWTAEDTINADWQRLQRILQDLLSRVEQRVYLCHSDLAVNGQEQDGPLLALVNAAAPINFKDYTLI